MNDTAAAPDSRRLERNVPTIGVRSPSLVPNQRLKPPGAAFLGWEQFDQRVHQPGNIEWCAAGPGARSLSAAR